jgi:multiple sugar transport system substrate-binding protein
MKRKVMAVGSLAAAAALALTACGGGGSSSNSDPKTLTISAWSVDSTPEFKLLAEGFEKEHEGVTVKLKQYDPAKYNTLVTADIAANSGPDIITQKEVKYLPTFQKGNQLLDVSDVKIPDDAGGADSHKVDGKAYAVPYRQDAWVLYYNMKLFDAAGVDYPDGSWTWDDYEAAAKKLTKGKAKGTFMYTWQSLVQGFAAAQTDSDVLGGKYGYLKDYYDRAVRLQDAKAQASFNTATANQLTYQGEFGKQKAAMMPMGTWYTATLIAQQNSGEADDFEWGMAPAPQLDSSTTGTDKTPVTFGDPTGFGINASVKGEKADLAKEFLEYAASEESAEALAKIGITPAVVNDKTTEAYFGEKGVPQDDLSEFAWSTREVKAENPPSSKTAAIQNILNDLHTAVLSGSTKVDAGIKEAEKRVSSEVD